jgi:DNA-binding transcriptional regulator PaaX
MMKRPSQDKILEFIKSEIDASRRFPVAEQIRDYMGYKNTVSVRHALANMAQNGMLVRDLNSALRVTYRLPADHAETPADHTLKYIVQSIDMFHGFPSRGHIRDELRIDGQSVNVILADLRQRGDITTQMIRKGRYKYVLTDSGRARVERWEASRA